MQSCNARVAGQVLRGGVRRAPGLTLRAESGHESSLRPADARPTTRILALVRSIPPVTSRRTATWSPGAPRRAGAVLAANDDPTLPWQRVVRADGSLAKGERQRARLQAEGVPFRGSRVDMRAAWCRRADSITRERSSRVRIRP